MYRHAAREPTHISLEQIEKDEWLQELTEIRWTHEPDDRTSTVSSGPINDSACHKGSPSERAVAWPHHLHAQERNQGQAAPVER
jgi:hypothetical protein